MPSLSARPSAPVVLLADLGLGAGSRNRHRAHLDGSADHLAESLEPGFRARRLDSPAGQPLDGPRLLGRLREVDASALLLVHPPERDLASTLSGLAAVRRARPGLPILAAARPAASGEATADTVLALLRLGVDDFITPPYRACDVQPRVWRLLPPPPRVEESEESAEANEAQRALPGPLRYLVGESPAFTAVVRQIPRFAGCGSTVLITGETGTGKEVVSRAIHQLSPRGAGPFVPVNCGAVPVELVENELFGHERSAFTGADSARRGVIAEAEGGTLLLDEIDTLPPAAQVKLLRFLQDREYRPLGAGRSRRADVRVLAATNTAVEEAVAQGRLRADLYYRLNVLPLALPPLRERQGDVALLARHFLARQAEELGVPCPALGPATLRLLLEHDWPGNVRELRHVMERAVVLAGDRGTLVPRDLWPARPEVRSGTAAATTFKEAKARVVARFERGYLEEMLRAHDGNVTQASSAAGKHRRAFQELIRKHDIDVGRFRH